MAAGRFETGYGAFGGTHAFGYGVIFAVLGLLYPLSAAILWWFYVRSPSPTSPPAPTSYPA